jgi:hypothetical protein
MGRTGDTLPRDHKPLFPLRALRLGESISSAYIDSLEFLEGPLVRGAL